MIIFAEISIGNLQWWVLTYNLSEFSVEKISEATHWELISFYRSKAQLHQMSCILKVPVQWIY